jgi:nucleoside-triphosphatase
VECEIVSLGWQIADAKDTILFSVRLLVEWGKKMPKRVLLLTGAPGVGKTSVLQKTVEALKACGVSVGGMVSREMREGGVRVGFEILDLAGGKRGWLAHVNQKSGPPVGKYRVCLADLEGIGVAAIDKANEKCSVVAVDEVGPMELFSDRFKQAVAKALDSAKPVLAVVHAKAQDPLIAAAKRRSDSEIFTVTSLNRDVLPCELARKILEALRLPL